MSKPIEKRKAVALRTRGFSYKDILRSVPVAKSTLSLWLRDVGLSVPQRQRLTARKLAAAHRGGEKVHLMRLARAARTVAEAEEEAKQQISQGDLLWLVGTVLYWAEGAKPKPWRGGTKVAFTNMDPRTILLMREWLRRYCSRTTSDIWHELYIHEGANIEAAREYWARQLGLPQERLRVCLKRSNHSTRRKNVGSAYYGIMRITARRSTLLNHRIEGWIKGLARHCGVGQREAVSL